MPPPPPQEITGNAVASRQRYRYTAADLQILHEIVSLASVIPENKSFRAIWRAYDTVLAARQINPALDSVYFRFILQLQGAEGNTLYDKFMQLLDNQGVDISETRFLETPAATSDYTRRRYEEARQRRDRATGVYTASEEEEEGYTAEDEYDKQHALPPLRRTGIGARSSRRSSGSQVGSGSSREGAVRAAEFAAEAHREEVRRRREQLSAGGYGLEGASIPDPPRVPENAADALYNLRMRTVLRGYFHHWHLMTIQHVEIRWFAVLERRAEARYDSGLLASAFRLWIRKTAVIVQRSQEVRERILARKYFGAWRQVVVESNTKIRLFQLSGALLKWRNNLVKKKEMATQAQEVFERNLAHRAYWTWFFKLCGVLGTRRSHEKLLSDKLSVWVDRTEEKIRMNRMAKAFFRSRTLQVVFEHWSFRTIKCLDQADVAADHREWSLAHSAFGVWRRETRFTPLLNAMVEFVSDRIGDTFFVVWRTRARQSIEAEEISRSRLLKPIFRNWRLRVRHNVMVERVDERIAICTLHEWVLHARIREFKVHSGKKLKADTLSHWVEKFRSRGDKMENLCHEMTVRRNRRIATTALRMLRRKLRLMQLSGSEAQAMYRSNLASRALGKWRAESDVYMQLDDWADDAVYYFTVKRTLKRWVRAFRGSRKQRLGVVYRTTARKTKRDLAARVMEVWKKKFNRIQEMNDTARGFGYGRVTDIFQRWQTRTGGILSLAVQAEEASDLRFMRQHLIVWIDHHTQIMEFEEQARVFSEEAAVRAAVKYFGLWVTKSWHLNMLSMTASGFERKRFKALFRRWRARAEGILSLAVQAEEASDLRVARQYLIVWTDHHNKNMELEEQARLFSEGATVRAAIKYFNLWKTRAGGILSLAVQAEEASDLRVMRQHLIIWTDHHNQNMELEEQARLFSEEATVRAAIKYFNLWETKSWHLNMLRMTASRFERKRFKALFRMWKVRTQDNIDSRLEEQERTRVHIPLGMDDTIEGGFGEDWIPPLQPGVEQSSTPLGTPNPPRSLTVVMPTPWRTSAATVLSRSRLFGRTPGGTPGGRLFGRTVDRTPASPLLGSTVRRSREFGRSRLGE